VRLDTVRRQPLEHVVVGRVNVDQRDLVHPSADYEVACRRRRL
jgi:hypothetical protein